MLAAEDLVYRIQGKGTFVADDVHPTPNHGDMEQLIRKMHQLSEHSTVETAEIKEVEPDPDVAADLRLAPGAKVLRVSFVRCLEDEPTGYRISFVPADRGLNFTVEDLKRHQGLTLLERKGVALSGADQLVGACLADTTKAALLKTAVGAPLVRVRLVTFDDEGNPVETSTAYYRAERYQHHVWLARSANASRPQLRATSA